ncbi:MAG TPA: NifU family protein [Isosphaeraceae bacterium]|jgi:Fe-S cluster biogenesis protein NfuA
MPMASAPDDPALLGRLRRLEALVQEAEHLADPAARAHVRELVRTLLDYHGAALARLLDGLAEAESPGGSPLIERLARDDLVASLLLLHGLHPLDLETRVRHALERVRPRLRTHGGDVALLGVSSEGVVRLRMQGRCHGCPSSAAALRRTIEEAIDQEAPDAVAIEVEDRTDDEPPRLVSLGPWPGQDDAPRPPGALTPARGERGHEAEHRDLRGIRSPLPPGESSGPYR